MAGIWTRAIRVSAQVSKTIRLTMFLENDKCPIYLKTPYFYLLYQLCVKGYQRLCVVSIRESQEKLTSATKWTLHYCYFN
jgi:hypothetical protein